MCDQNMGVFDIRVFVCASLYDGLHLCDCKTSVQMAALTPKPDIYC